MIGIKRRKNTKTFDCSSSSPVSISGLTSSIYYMAHRGFDSRKNIYPGFWHLKREENDEHPGEWLKIHQPERPDKVLRGRNDCN